MDVECGTKDRNKLGDDPIVNLNIAAVSNIRKNIVYSIDCN